MNSVNKWRPKTTGEYVIIVGFILYLVGSALHDILFKNGDPFVISDSKAIADWTLKLLRDIGFAIGFGGMVVVGIRQLRNDFSLKKLIMPSIGFLFLASMALTSFYTSAMMKSTFENLEMVATYTGKAENYYKEKINDKNISMAEKQNIPNIMLKSNTMKKA